MPRISANYCNVDVVAPSRLTVLPPEAPASAAFVVWRGLVLLGPGERPEPVAFEPADVAGSPLLAVVSAPNELAAYILEADEAAAQATIAQLAPGGSFGEIMFDLGRFAPERRRRLERAVAIERWSNRYRFCPACGTPLIWTTDGIAKICTRPQRVHRHFPRLDPAIIVLVTDGDRALLGRSKRFPPGFFSTLAGFVEPGESVEAALRREVFEEAGIHVGATQYFGSEPWPFPRSLMLGYFAAAQTTTIALNDAELEEAHWFDRAELAALQARMKTARPHFDTIARRLIDAWLAGRTEPGP